MEPKILSAQKSIEGVPVKKRNCRFPHEHDPERSIFKQYGHKSCLFECMWRQAKEFCECIPWSYPHFGNGSFMCDTFGNTCWHAKMMDGLAIMNCDCEFECNKITYSFYTNRHEFKPAECVSTGYRVFQIRRYFLKQGRNAY